MKEKLYSSVDDMLQDIENEWNSYSWFKKLIFQIGWKSDDMISVFKPYRMKNVIKFTYQKIRYGFSDDEMWSLNYNFAKHIYPRLKKFYEIEKADDAGYPGIFSEEFEGSDENLHERWVEVLEKMVKSFDMILHEEKYINHKSENYREEAKKYNSEIQEGLNLFSKYFQGLWN